MLNSGRKWMIHSQIVQTARGLDHQIVKIMLKVAEDIAHNLVDFDAACFVSKASGQMDGLKCRRLLYP